MHRISLTESQFLHVANAVRLRENHEQPKGPQYLKSKPRRAHRMR